MQCARRRTNCRSRCDDSRVAPKLVRNSSSVGRLSDQAMGVCTLVTSSCPKLMLSCVFGTAYEPATHQLRQSSCEAQDERLSLTQINVRMVDAVTTLRRNLPLQLLCTLRV